MQIWGITIRPIIFPIVAIPVITISGVLFWKMQNRNFVPTTIDQRQVDQSRSQLTAVRELKGAWGGTADFRRPTAGGGSCTWSERINLIITDQSENGITGNMTFTALKGTAAGPVRCISGANGTAPFAADLTGTRINNLARGNYIFSGSYTQDTITLNQTNDTGNNMVGTLNLLRQN